MPSSLNEELKKELLILRDDSKDFIRGMFDLLKQREDREEVLEAIQYGEIKTSADAILWALSIYREKYELRDLLENICDDEGFIKKILAMAQSEEKDTLAVAMQNEEIKTPEEILRFALKACQNKEKE